MSGFSRLREQFREDDGEFTIWEEPAQDRDRVPTTSDAIRAQRTAPPPTLQADLEQAMIAVLTSPKRVTESHAAAGDRRERELAAHLTRLDPFLAHHLMRRIQVARRGDAIATAFLRLTQERRARLIRLLADAPRRAALLR